MLRDLVAYWRLGCLFRELVAMLDPWLDVPSAWELLGLVCSPLGKCAFVTCKDTWLHFNHNAELT